MENLTTVVKNVTVYACSHVSLITTNMMDYAQVAIEHGDLESFEEWLEEAYTPLRCICSLQLVLRFSRQLKN